MTTLSFANGYVKRFPVLRHKRHTPSIEKACTVHWMFELSDWMFEPSSRAFREEDECFMWFNSVTQATDIKALYIHIPFCARRCAYCDFATSAIARDDPRIAAYIEALVHELHELAALGLLAHIQTIYIGGGTPSFVGIEHLLRLLDAIYQLCAPSELSVEANPDSLDKGMPCALKDAGVTRISLGIQSLQAAELSALGRLHTHTQALSALDACLCAGLITSCDLMCAIPAQSPTSFEQSLIQVVSMQPQHMSVYPLQVEAGTPLAQLEAAGKVDIPTDDEAARYMQQAKDILEAANMHRYEVASYARDGHVCSHNIAYWTGVPYVGLGHAAASMLTPAQYRILSEHRAELPSMELMETELPPMEASCAHRGDTPARVRLMTRWQDAITATSATTAEGLVPIQNSKAYLSVHSYDVELLSLQEAVAEDLMLAARMNTSLDAHLLEIAHSIFGDALSKALYDLVRQAYLSEDLKPTDKGWLKGNEVFRVLWGLAQGTA